MKTREQLGLLQANTGELMESHENMHMFWNIILLSVFTQEDRTITKNGLDVQGRGGRQIEGCNDHEARSPWYDK